MTVCNTYELPLTNPVLVRKGDVYAVYLRSPANSLPILASLPTASGRRLLRDARSFVDVLITPDLRRNQLEVVNDLGVHLFADIGELDTEYKIILVYMIQY